MVSPSGETRGSVAHSSSNTSIGSKVASSSSATISKDSSPKSKNVKKELFMERKEAGKWVLFFMQQA